MSYAIKAASRGVEEQLAAVPENVREHMVARIRAWRISPGQRK